MNISRRADRLLCAEGTHGCVLCQGLHRVVLSCTAMYSRPTACHTKVWPKQYTVNFLPEDEEEDWHAPIGVRSLPSYGRV